MEEQPRRETHFSIRNGEEWKMRASLPVQIEDLHPSAVYRGQVYTQDAILAIEDGTEFKVYDPDRLISPEMKNIRRRVELVVFMAVVTTTPEEEREIKFDTEGRPVFRGRVSELEGNDEGILDVGTGSIRFTPSEAEEGVQVGNYLQITRGAIHLTDVEGRRTFEDEYEFYLDRLSNGDSEERRMAARHLGSLGSERGIDDLILTLHHDEEPRVRAEVATALGRIGMAARPPTVEQDPRIIENLEEAVSDGNDIVEQAARLALEDIEKSNQDHMHSRDW